MAGAGQDRRRHRAGSADARIVYQGYRHLSMWAGIRNVAGVNRLRTVGTRVRTSTVLGLSFCGAGSAVRLFMGVVGFTPGSWLVLQWRSRVLARSVGIIAKHAGP